jgi:4-aminobutyrate aminotransferase-like enzyme
LLANGPRPDTLRFMPALTRSDAAIDRTIDILDTVLRTATPTKESDTA